MQLPTLTITRDEAHQHLREYRRARQTIVLTREEERMVQAYKAIADGHKVIDLHRALELGGHDDHFAELPNSSKLVTLPRLAAFRSDQRWTWCDGIGNDGTVTFRSTMARKASPVGELRLQFVELFERATRDTLNWWRDPAYRAMVPPVPPHLRPTRRHGGKIVPLDLKGFVTLFEAEWQLDRTVPPGDPALLRRLGGTLYRVVATWDLTPVEQAVLAGRRPTSAEIGER